MGLIGRLLAAPGFGQMAVSEGWSGQPAGGTPCGRPDGSAPSTGSPSRGLAPFGWAACSHELAPVQRVLGEQRERAASTSPWPAPAWRRPAATRTQPRGGAGHGSQPRADWWRRLRPMGAPHGPRVGPRTRMGPEPPGASALASDSEGRDRKACRWPARHNRSDRPAGACASQGRRPRPWPVQVGMTDRDPSRPTVHTTRIQVVTHDRGPIPRGRAGQARRSRTGPGRDEASNSDKGRLQ